METYRWSYCAKCGILFLKDLPPPNYPVENNPEILISTVPSATPGMCSACWHEFNTRQWRY